MQSQVVYLEWTAPCVDLLCIPLGLVSSQIQAPGCILITCCDNTTDNVVYPENVIDLAAPWLPRLACPAAVILPTIWRYLQTLGAAPYFLGLGLSAFSLSGLLSGPLFGLWSDRTRTTKKIILIANLFEIVGKCVDKLKGRSTAYYHFTDVTDYIET